MKMTTSRVLGRSAVWLVAAACGIACAPADEASESSADEIKLEGRDLVTPLASLRAGSPFTPGLDESLLEVGDPCLEGVEITASGGTVSSAAKVVHNRKDLSRSLGLIADVPIPKAPGVTGTLNLSHKVDFDGQSAVVLFHATGTYTSAVTKVASEPPQYSPSSISRCGFGYVENAKHRVSAALVVSVRSTDSTKTTTLTDSGISGGDIGSIKANLTNIISQGNVEVSVRFATDVIPNLPDAPLGDTVIVVTNDETAKQEAITKLNNVLNWLGQAHSSIQSYINDVQLGSADVVPAPTESIRFRFYPGTPASVKKTMEVATTNAGALRSSVADAYAMFDNWATFDREANEGGGYMWNIPGAPLGTIDELRAKKREMLDDGGGKLTRYRDQVDTALEGCVNALRNEDNRENAVSLIARACQAPAALPFDRKANELRPIVALSVSQSSNNRGKCGAGQRKPLEAEAKLFGPWSRKLKQLENQGLWMEKSGCRFSSGWLFDGAPACTPFGSVRQGKTVCVSTEKGPTPND